MISAAPSHRAPADQVHGNSMHPKVRAVLDRGLAHEWSSKEVADLLRVELRSAQQLMNSEHLHSFAHPTKNSERGVLRTTGLSLLLYLLRHSDEITETDAQPIIKKVLPLLTDSILQGVMGACKSIIHARSGILVAVKDAPAAEAAQAAEPAAEAPKSAPRAKADPFAGMPDLFA